MSAVMVGRRTSRDRFVDDSALEETGFEPSVPRKMPASCPVSLSRSRLSRRGKFRKRRHELILERPVASRGTEGSNLVPSSGESGANKAIPRRPAKRRRDAPRFSAACCHLMRLEALPRLASPRYGCGLRDQVCLGRQRRLDWSPPEWSPKWLVAADQNYQRQGVSDG